MRLSPTMRDVIVHWGEMGAAWGVNRSVGQIHALLFLAGQPLHAEDISETLSLARSNVSNSLKELLEWELIARRHQFGDRRDYYEAEGELWDVLIKIADGRKKREIDPTLAALAAAVEQSKTDGETPAEVRKRIEDLHGFVSQMSGWYEQMRDLPRATILKLMALGARIAKFVSG